MEPRFYRLGSDTRRCVIYILIGIALYGAIIYCMQRYDLWERTISQAELGCILGLTAAAFLGMLIPFRWRLRVDAAGISRRWLLEWDHWSWDDFASGRIRKEQLSFVDPNRPATYRTLDLHWLTEEDRKAVVDLINTHYRLPPPPVIPDTLQIQYAFRRTIEFLGDMIRLQIRGESHRFEWQDVQRLHITRYDALRRDFTSLEITLPGHEIRLIQNSNWNTEELNELLLGRVPAYRIEVDIEGECPTRVSDIQKQVSREKEKERGFQMCMVIIGSIGTVGYAAIAIKEGVINSVFLEIASLAFLALCTWLFHLHINGNKKHLEARLAHLQHAPSVDDAKC